MADLTHSGWFFPTIGQYSAILEESGFEVRFATLFDRPTPLEEGEQGLHNWLAMFAARFFANLDEAERERVLERVAEDLRPALWQDERWVADYRRIRIVAVKR